MSRSISLCFATALLLSGCASVEGRRVATGVREPISLRDDDDMCGMSLVQTYVGLRANDTVRNQVQARSEAATIRWIAAGSAVTMDFRGDRLNAVLDENGVIETLRCG
jgi:nitrous oxide reductase accessory protein NosL